MAEMAGTPVEALTRSIETCIPVEEHGKLHKQAHLASREKKILA